MTIIDRILAERDREHADLLTKHMSSVDIRRACQAADAITQRKVL